MSTPIQRNRKRAALFASLSLVVAAGTAYVAWKVVDRYERQLVEVRVTDEAQMVVVAATDLPPGHRLVPEDLVVERRAVGSDTQGLFTTVDELGGQVVGERVLAGEVLRRERLVSGGASLRVNELLEPGTRAVTVRANRASAVGGLLEPNFYVDVIVTIRPDNQTLAAEWVTETILQGVRVLAVGDEVTTGRDEKEEGDREKYERYASRETWVTLEVEPEEAEQIAMGSARGELHLSLRGRDDFALLDPGTPLVTNALVGLPKPVVTAQARRLTRQQHRVITPSRPTSAPAVAPAAPPAHTTNIIRGGQITVEQYDAQGNRIEPRK